MGNANLYRSYTPKSEQDKSATIVQAALATSAAPSFFDEVKIDGVSGRDGGLVANNPVYKVEREASDIWCPESGDLKQLVKCFISIGTGNPGPNPITDSAYKFLTKTVVSLATETESTAQDFISDWRGHLRAKKYFRFNVEQGLQSIGLEEYKKKGDLEEATLSYLREEKQSVELQFCIANLSSKESVSVEMFN
jgi:predicted acylesterase/phospholipase RssA